MWVRAELRQSKQPGVLPIPQLSQPFTQRGDIRARCVTLRCTQGLGPSSSIIIKLGSHSSMLALPPCKTYFSFCMPAFLSAPTRHSDSLATESALALCFIHIFFFLWPNFLWFRRHKKMRHKGNFSQGLKPLFKQDKLCKWKKGHKIVVM